MAQNGRHDERTTHEYDQAVDLRRKKRAEMASELVTRAKWLPAAERELIRTVYEHGRPVSELAPLLCVSPRTLRRRCRKAVSRALSDEYIYVLRHRDRWPAMLGRVATVCIIEGKSLRAAAQELGVTLHTVRRYRELVMGMIETSKNEPALKPDARRTPPTQSPSPYAPAWQDLDQPKPKPAGPKRVIKQARPFDFSDILSPGGSR